MLITSVVLFGLAASVFLLAGTVAALCHLVTKSSALSLAVGTLAIPALICVSLVYAQMTMEVDDAPPGMLIIGNLIAIAVITPIALLASRLTTRFLDRRASRNVS